MVILLEPLDYLKNYVQILIPNLLDVAHNIDSSIRYEDKDDSIGNLVTLSHSWFEPFIRRVRANMRARINSLPNERPVPKVEDFTKTLDHDSPLRKKIISGTFFRQKVGKSFPEVEENYKKFYCDIFDEVDLNQKADVEVMQYSLWLLISYPFEILRVTVQQTGSKVKADALVKTAEKFQRSVVTLVLSFPSIEEEKAEESDFLKLLKELKELKQEVKGLKQQLNGIEQHVIDIKETLFTETSVPLLTLVPLNELNPKTLLRTIREKTQDITEFYCICPKCKNSAHIELGSDKKWWSQFKKYFSIATGVIGIVSGFATMFQAFSTPKINWSKFSGAGELKDKILSVKDKLEQCDATDFVQQVQDLTNIKPEKMNAAILIEYRKALLESIGSLYEEFQNKVQDVLSKNDEKPWRFDRNGIFCHVKCN